MLDEKKKLEKPFGDKIYKKAIKKLGLKIIMEIYNGKFGEGVRNALINELADKEWERGRHGARDDETLGHCTRCGRHDFLKKVGKELLCRRCRDVCDDCGREDIPKEKLEPYGSGGFPILCPDCRVCRLY
jgi:hypothetical protein